MKKRISSHQFRIVNNDLLADSVAGISINFAKKELSLKVIASGETDTFRDAFAIARLYCLDLDIIDNSGASLAGLTLRYLKNRDHSFSMDYSSNSLVYHEYMFEYHSADPRCDPEKKPQTRCRKIK